jgi:predicted HAD superfamily Cof-like phosphohydrolase|tara:strand:+ start:204 stop:665 length:462 start_codon:yes stop_codon:yes gene_type:complete
MKLWYNIQNGKGLNMSENWVQDINDMHRKFGVHDWVSKQLVAGDKEKLQEFLKFRIKFLQEELGETANAVDVKDPEEIVDGLIDLCVVAIGTMDAFGVDAHKAWNEIHNANMSKESGVKESRPNPLGLPDLIKPDGWKGPEHGGNHGYFTNTF